MRWGGGGQHVVGTNRSKNKGQLATNIREPQKATAQSLTGVRASATGHPDDAARRKTLNSALLPNHLIGVIRGKKK